MLRRPGHKKAKIKAWTNETSRGLLERLAPERLGIPVENCEGMQLVVNEELLPDDATLEGVEAVTP